ncbi:hypothetical protein ACP70R_010867 [Stipagrostis hirtigluma subsp. patula]
MDQLGEKEENKFQESTGRREEDADEGNSAEKSTGDDGEGGKAADRHQLKEVVSEEEEASLLFAHPCSLLQYLLRACAGFLGLHGAFGDRNKPAPAAVAAADDGGAAPANSSSQQGDGAGGEKANEEVVSRVWAVRTRRPPERPREGSGGSGGAHH